MRDDQEAYELIRKEGGVFYRRAKHGPLFKLPNGEIIGFSTSTGDHRALKQLKSELRRKLRKD